MCRLLCATVLATLAALAVPPAARAGDAMQCVAVNGNVTCSATGAASCQRVDGRTVCVAAGGAVEQSFGAAGAGAEDGVASVPGDMEAGDDAQ